jgi:hypothetical protein
MCIGCLDQVCLLIRNFTPLGNPNWQTLGVQRNRLNILLTSVIHIRWTKKAHRTSQQLVEFTFLIAWEQCVARFNRAHGIEADNVSGKGSCLTPLAR